MIIFQFNLTTLKYRPKYIKLTTDLEVTHHTHSKDRAREEGEREGRDGTGEGREGMGGTGREGKLLLPQAHTAVAAYDQNHSVNKLCK